MPRTPCINECTQRGKHLPDCPENTCTQPICPKDHCTGCEPRYAHPNTTLCGSCIYRLRKHLTDIPTLITWLDGHLTPGSRPKPDPRTHHTHTKPGPRIGIDPDIHDTVIQLATIIWEWIDLLKDSTSTTLVGTKQALQAHIGKDGWSWLKDQPQDPTQGAIGRYTLTGPEHHTPQAAATYLLTHLNQVLTLEPVDDLLDELDTIFKHAHAIAPWTPERRRLNNIECPNCTHHTLVIEGGQDQVWCTRCHTSYNADRYRIWAAINQTTKDTA